MKPVTSIVSTQTPILQALRRHSQLSLLFILGMRETHAQNLSMPQKERDSVLFVMVFWSMKHPGRRGILLESQLQFRNLGPGSSYSTANHPEGMYR